MTTVDVLIVGQGIAGTLLAHELTQRGQRLVVIDEARPNASTTCAGMVNPVVLKRFSPVWQGEAQIHCARQTLATLAEKLAVELDFPFDILRIFHDEQERTTWQNKAELPALTGLLDKQTYPSPSPVIHAPHGVGKVHLGGRVDVVALLKAYRQHLQTRRALFNAPFDYAALQPVAAGWQYGDITASQVVFCEGYGIKNNPYFKTLPLNGNKGEVLIVRIPELKLTAAIKSAVFIMPLPTHGDDVYFVGATYHWTEKDNQPTAAGKAQLLEKLQKMLSESAFQSLEVLAHHAGMRPTVSDRRPLLGRHPEHSNLLVFNGLGTRGVMLGATMAKHLAALMVDGTPLPAEVDIARFASA
ncbi:MAG: FAD-dependent oxidoreductase [Gammaproteobacteria bacterium]|nr:MAG: FAD-dependent oxidoreductase [Gammaproteobacteria bacterium]